jgi:hypothetical protein
MLRLPLAGVFALVLLGAGADAQEVEPAPAPSPSPEPSPSPGPAAPAVQINAYASASYNHNFNRPVSRRNTLRGFETTDDSFTLDVIELVAQHAVSDPGDLGFRADFQAGSAIPRTPAPGDEGGDPRKAEDVEIQQAMVHWIAPLGRGLRLDAGKMVSPIAWEVLDGYDGYNDHATTTFLFYGVPFTYTGLKVSYPVADTVTVAGYLVNGWDVGADNNEGKTVAGLVSWAATAELQLTLNGITGHERDGIGVRGAGAKRRELRGSSAGIHSRRELPEDEGTRSLVDLVAAWKPTGRLTFAANLHFATEGDALGAGNDAAWNGQALYAKVLLGRKGGLSVRGERFEDEHGVRTGTAQTLTAFTVTPEYRLADNAVVRFDVRFDSSDELVFEDEEGDLTSGQTTFTANVLVTF